MISIKKITVADIEINDVVFSDVEDAIKLINALRKSGETLGEKIEVKIEETLGNKNEAEKTLGEKIEVKIEETLGNNIEVEQRQETMETIEELTISDIEIKFNKSELAEITKKKYFGAIKRIVSWFGLSVNELFKYNVDNIINSINTKYPNKNTRNLYLSSVMSVYKFYGITDLYDIVYSVFKNKQEPIEEPTEEPIEEPVEVPVKEQIEEPTEEPIEEPTEGTKPIEEAYEIMDTIQTKYEELKTNLTNEYDENRMYCAVGCLFLKHGVQRGSELINTYINPNGVCEYSNYIDIENKKMIIGDHKTVKKSGIRTFDLCEDFIEIVKDYPNRFLVTNRNGDNYQDATGFSKKLKSIYGNMNYEIRKAKSSINLAGIDENLAKIQGHSIAIMNSNYRSFK